MNIKEQFNFVAQEYDANRKKFIPCFDDYYENTTKFIVSNIEKPKRVLDLGAGTGLLSYFWYHTEEQYHALMKGFEVVAKHPIQEIETPQKLM